MAEPPLPSPAPEPAPEPEPEPESAPEPVSSPDPAPEPAPVPAPPPRREHPALRWATTAWLLMTGALLSVAPHAPAWDASPLLEAAPFLSLAATRWSISGLGLAVLAAGAWDVSRFIVGELS